MQIMIDVPDELYGYIRLGGMLPSDIPQFETIISNGIPLPKGHGRIVDGDLILLWLINRGIIDKLKCGEIAKLFEQATIIEADSEVENGSGTMP